MSTTELSVAVRTELEQIGRQLAQTRNAIAFTGAGISTQSGLPDYRGSNGLWQNRRFEELAHIDAFAREPGEFWRFYRERLVKLRGAVPNPAHLVVARLEEEGLLRGLITQNVDGLHRAAVSRLVVELHGSLRGGECLVCRAVRPMAEIECRLAAAPDGVPRCDCGSPLKPAVVLFGEVLPAGAVTTAVGLARDADYMLCLGSSLHVSPASAMPVIVLENGGLVAIVNQGETDLDDRPGVRKVEAPLAVAMPIVLDAALAARRSAGVHRR